MRKIQLSLFILLSLFINNVTAQYVSEFNKRQGFDECYIEDTLKNFHDFDTLRFLSYAGNKCTCFLENGSLLKTLCTYNDGSVMECNYQDGKMHGAIAQYDKHGLIYDFSYMLNDTDVTPRVFSYPNGRPCFINFGNLLYSFYEDGKIYTKEIDTIINQRQTTIKKCFHSNGKPSFEYIEGVNLITQLKEYFSNGLLKREGQIKFFAFDISYNEHDSTEQEWPCNSYKEFMKLGTWYEYYETGVIKQISNYSSESEKKQIKNGKWYYYDEKGQTIKEELWENNLLIK